MSKDCSTRPRAHLHFIDLKSTSSSMTWTHECLPHQARLFKMSIQSIQKVHKLLKAQWGKNTGARKLGTKSMQNPLFLNNASKHKQTVAGQWMYFGLQQKVAELSGLVHKLHKETRWAGSDEPKTCQAIATGQKSRTRAKQFQVCIISTARLGVWFYAHRWPVNQTPKEYIDGACIPFQLYE